MTAWAIQIPHRSRGESLVDVAAHARQLAGDDRAVCRQLVIGARLDGVAATAGELLDHLEQLEPHERRAMLDRARAEVGLEPVDVVEGRERLEVAAQMNRASRSSNSAFQSCHSAAGCSQVPVHEVGGALRAVNVRRWFWPAHVDEAVPGDMEPRPVGLRYAPSGAIVEYDPADDAREAAAAETRRRRRDAERAEREADAVQLRANREARRRQEQRELPEFLRDRA